MTERSNSGGGRYRTLSGHSRDAFSPDGRVIASAVTTRHQTLAARWHPAENLSGHTAAVGELTSPDGQTIASVSVDKTVKLWRRDGTLLRTFYGHSDTVYGVAFSPDGRTLASA